MGRVRPLPCSLSMSPQRLSDGFNHNSQYRGGDSDHKGHRIDPEVTKHHENDRQQNEKLSHQLKEGVLLPGEEVPAQDAAKPAKIQQANSSAQDDSQGDGPASKPETRQKKENQDLGAALLDGNQLLGFLLPRRQGEITFFALLCQSLLPGKQGCGTLRQHPESG